MVQMGRRCWAGTKNLSYIYAELAFDGTPKQGRLTARSGRRMRFV
jgi:hypothetical protein